MRTPVAAVVFCMLAVPSCPACSASREPVANAAAAHTEYESVPPSRLVDEKAIRRDVGSEIETELAFWSAQADARFLPSGFSKREWIGLHAAPEGTSQIVGLVAKRRSECVQRLLGAEVGTLIVVQGRIAAAESDGVASVLVLDDCELSPRQSKARAAKPAEADDLPLFE